MHLQSKHPTSAVGTRKIWHAPLRLLQHATHSQCRDWLVCSGQQKAEAGTLRTSVQKNRRRESPDKRHFRTRLRQARGAACPAAAGRGDGRRRRGPAMRRGPALILTCFRGRVLARVSHRRVSVEQLVVMCRTSRCQCRRRLGVCDAAFHVPWQAARSAAAAYVRCSPSRGAGLAGRPIASGGRVFPVCFEGQHILVGDA
jgi:hypothetical protein